MPAGQGQLPIERLREESRGPLASALTNLLQVLVAAGFTIGDARDQVVAVLDAVVEENRANGGG